MDTKYVQRGIKMPKQTGITWNFPRSDWTYLQQHLQKPKEGPTDATETWSLMIESDRRPRDRTTNRQSWLRDPCEYWLKIRLNKWPQEIGRMSVKYRVLIYHKAEGKEDTEGTWDGIWNKWEGDVWDEDHQMIDWEYHKLPVPQKMRRFGHNFVYPHKMEIQLIVDEIFDRNVKKIPKTEWNTYGIMD